MKTFQDVLQEMKDNVSTTKNGKQKKTFNRSDFDKLSSALLNEIDYSVDTVNIRSGEMVTKKTEPVKEFRGMMKKVLLDYGVDSQEAESMVTGEYKFGNTSAMYPIVASSIVEYCKAGKKFDFPTEQEFKASLVINDVDETEKMYASIRKPGDTTEPEKFTVKTKKHKTLKASSKPPKWLKKKFK